MESLVILLAILAVAYLLRLVVQSLPAIQPAYIKGVLVAVIALGAAYLIATRLLGYFG